MSTTARKARVAVAATGAILAALTLVGCAAPADYSSPEGPCTVNNKDRSSNDGHSKFLVYTDQCGVLTVDDAILENKWNSSDTYAAIKVGHTYEFVTYGFRNGFISSYPNILSAVEVNK